MDVTPALKEIWFWTWLTNCNKWLWTVVSDLIQMKITIQKWCSTKIGDCVRKNSCISPLLPLLTPGSTFHTLSSSPTQAGYPTIQFNSDTNQSWHRPHRLKAQLQETALPCRCQWHVMPTRLSTTSIQLGYKSESPQPTLWINSFARTPHKTQGNIYLCLHYSI